MIRTQVQLPDGLYHRLRALAENKEWSISEAVRRSVEMLLQSYPRDPTPSEEWELPQARALGGFLIPPDGWRSLGEERTP